MALPVGWQFGSGRSDEQLGPMGGFTLGGFQSPFAAPASTVATPSAGVAGSAPSASSPTGGMDALRPPFDQPPSSGPSAEPASDPGNANVTGFNGPLANAAITAATLGMPNPFAGLGLIGGLGANLAARAGLGMGIGAIPGNLSTNGDMTADSGTTIPTGTPVTYSGNNAFGFPTGSLVANVPTPNPRANDDGITPQGLSVMVPSASPNPPSANGNPNAPGMFGSLANLFSGNPNPANIPPAKGSDNDPDAPVGPPGPVSTDPSEGMSNSGPTGQGPGGPGAGAGPGSGAAGASGGAPGAGDAGGGSPGSGGTGAGASAGDKRGGVVGQERARQRGQRPDPRMLAAKLQRGAKVDVGRPNSRTDDVPVELSRGEFVINRAATRQNLPELERINASAPRSAGGMAVGRPREARR